MLARIDAVAARLPPPPGGKVSRSNVLRAALDRGLSSLEADTARPTSPAGPANIADLLAELDALRAKVAAMADPRAGGGA